MVPQEKSLTVSSKNTVQAAATVKFCMMRLVFLHTELTTHFLLRVAIFAREAYTFLVELITITVVRVSSAGQAACLIEIVAALHKNQQYTLDDRLTSNPKTEASNELNDGIIAG